MSTFVPGRELSQRLYTEVIGPLLADQSPQLRYAAAHIGAGSDVLGFDTPLSTDHDWGPRMTVFLEPSDDPQAETLQALFTRSLPSHVGDYPVLGINITTLPDFLWDRLRYDVNQPLTAADWLSFGSQQLLEITAGTIHYDATGALTAARTRLAAYPRDVWLYMMAASWHRIAQEEHLMPRAGSVGDELGSALIGSRLVRDAMQLGFLMEQRYAPYPKWFGTAFQQLGCATELTPLLHHVHQSATWSERETALCAVYRALARLHNALTITEPISDEVSPFYDRPFRVIGGDRFADALGQQIVDPDVQRIAARRLIGGIDHWSDSTDLRSDVSWRPIIRRLYDVSGEK